MPGIWTILKIIGSIFAGIGVASAADKYFPGKVSGYEPVSPGFRPGRKLAIFVGSMGIGALAWNFINRKFHIIARRHAPKRSRRRRNRRR